MVYRKNKSKNNKRKNKSENNKNKRKIKTKTKIKNKKEKLENILIKKLDKINFLLERNNVLELVELLGNRKELFLRNLLTGIAKGVGIGIGVTILSAILLIILQKIVTLNIPIIGDYVADIIEIVENKK